MPPADTLAVTGVGMACSLALDVITACAAARAGLQRPAPMSLTVADEKELVSVPLKGHSAAGALTAGFEGRARWQRLAAAALEDLVGYAGLTPALGVRTGIVLHLPGDLYDDAFLDAQLAAIPGAEGARMRADFVSERAERRQLALQRLLPALLAGQQLNIAPAVQAYSFGGAAAFVGALQTAAEWLHRRVVDRCLVGAVDSHCDDGVLEVLHQLGLLQTPARPVGFFPGEAGAFLLLERPDAARARGARIEALLGATAIEKEKGHRFAGEPCTGAALTAAAAGCFKKSAAVGAEAPTAIVNLNGDESRARDFGGALVRMKAAGVKLGERQWYPAVQLGELGAATGAVSACLAVRAFARDYAGSASILTLLLDDDDTRAAFLLHDAGAASGGARS